MRKDCIICGDEIFRSNSKLREKRGINSVTCSRRCAKIYRQRNKKTMEDEIN